MPKPAAVPRSLTGTPGGPRWTRRALLGGAAALGAAAATTGLAGCGGRVAISSDPSELVLWYWARSINPTLLDRAAKQIPDSTKRIRGDVIGGNYDSKLRTSMAGGAYIPDVAGVNSNCSLYFPNEDAFVDLNTLGGADLQGGFYPWKWQLGLTPRKRMCFWPMDTGPTGFYYRQDLFAKAGLPSEPDEVSRAIADWDGFLDLGTQMRQKLDVSLDIFATAIYNCSLNASEERYFDRSDRPLYHDSGSAVRRAWDLAVKAASLGVTANLQSSNDQNAGWTSGKVAGHLEAVWWGPILADTAPDTSGKWRLASQPVRPGNSGGSFLMVPATSKDPQAAFDFIRWLTDADNQAGTFNEIQLFPSTPASFDGDKLKSDNSFYGGQSYQDFFRRAAEQVPITYVSPYENLCSVFTAELTNVESGGKNSEQAWNDAVTSVDRALRKRGLL